MARKTVSIASASGPQEQVPSPERPRVVASANGLAACNRAMEVLKQGSDPLDAIIAGVNLVEDDPNDHSVGLGGLPNEDGIVELDACVMHGPTHKSGAVAALRGIRNPSSVARLVMTRTDHVLLVGEGARKLALAHGFTEEELLTDEARRIWLEWKEKHTGSDAWLDPRPAQESSPLPASGPASTHGTIVCLGLTADGDLAGGVSTAGRAFKIAGRVSDSAVCGAGLYVDNAVGACGSTGRGEANLLNCSSFMAVELMRGGATPEEACRRVLQRVADKTEPRLRDRNKHPNYDLTLYALRRDGAWGGACFRGKGKMAVHDGADCRLVEFQGLFPPP
jgi:N4-(beta-N-acetylglucosaminyl)-L-asparaginase